MFEIKGRFNTAKVFATSVDDVTISQIMELCNQEWAKDCNIAIMPDTHAGAGCTIGTTMTIKDKVCPNLVGVDISCGMLTVELPDEIKEIDLKQLDDFINNNIPSGFNVNEVIMYNPTKENLYLEDLKCFDNLKNVEFLKKSVGSLGSGNHFVELDQDEDGKLYLVIHSGSRNLGKQVAEYYQELANQDCNRHKVIKLQKQKDLINILKRQGRHQEIQKALEKFNQEYQEEFKIKKELCYLEGEHLKDYLHDMGICQKYASLSRKTIAKNILNHLFEVAYPDKRYQRELNFEGQDITFKYKYPDFKIQFKMFETIHNYIDLEHMILRKGAISAQMDEIVLIPINMRDGAIIARGKGNPEYNYSGPHGAGRLMSRGEAKEKVSIEEFQDSMKGIYSTSVMESTIDESPMAYKPIEEIIENIQDTVKVVKIIKPIYNFKAH